MIPYYANKPIKVTAFQTGGPTNSIWVAYPGIYNYEGNYIATGHGKTKKEAIKNLKINLDKLHSFIKVSLKDIRKKLKK